MGFTPDVHDLKSELAPLHHPGAIQPHGALLSLDVSGVIVQLAGDTCRAVGIAPDALLGRRIDTLTDREGNQLDGAITGHDARPVFVARWHPAPPGEGAWDVTVHVSGPGTIVEFEPAAAADRTAAQAMAGLGRAVAALEQPQDLDGLYRAAADQVRRMTGFDRVLVCRFEDDEAGTVVAEACGDALPSLPDQRLPGPAIAQQARGLDPRNRFQTIPDVNYVPAPLRPAATGTNAPSPDVSACTLLDASPVHLHYLRNLGVAASMSIPVIVDHVPWGMIAGHHAQPRHVPYEIREACQHVGRVLSQQIEGREEDSRHRERASLRNMRTAWLEELRLLLDSTGQVELDPGRLATLVPCDGVAVVSPGRVALAGQTPGEAETMVLAGWLEEALRHDVFATRHLAGPLPAAAAYAAQASGVLATTIDAQEPVILMWFRVEENTRVASAGHPHDADAAVSSPARLPPWSSVESPKRTIRQTARAWSRSEVNAVRLLGHSLTAILQQQALRDLDSRLRDTLAEQQSLVAQKNLLMQEVHHRVQNSLQIVNSMLQLQARQTADPRVRAPFEGAVHRLMAVSAVHRHLWRSSDAQNVHLGSYLRELCADLMRSWGDGWSDHVTVEAPQVTILSQTAVTLALLVTELLTNAAKYAYGGAPGPVWVVVSQADDGELCVAVRDQGLGMDGAILGSGLGSKLIRIFTAQLGGRVQTRTGAKGTTVTIVLPLPQRGAIGERGSSTPA